MTAKTTTADERALELAIAFHTIYERLAPSYGYETREESRQFDPESKNGRLMVATCLEILQTAKIAPLDAYQALYCKDQPRQLITLSFELTDGSTFLKNFQETAPGSFEPVPDPGPDQFPEGVKITATRHAATDPESLDETVPSYQEAERPFYTPDPHAIEIIKRVKQEGPK